MPIPDEKAILQEPVQDEAVSSSTDVDEPPDGGWGWVIIASVFWITFLSFGAVYSIGILFDVFREEFGVSSADVSAMASTTLSLQCFLGPAVSHLQNRFGTRKVVFTGCCLISLSFILSALAPNMIYLFISFGILGGVGMATAFLPAWVIMSYYFKKRRSLATALGGIGAYVGTFAYPYLIQFLISTYGWRGTMLLIGGLVMNSIPASLLLRPLRHAPNNNIRSSVDSEAQLLPERRTSETRRSSKKVVRKVQTIFEPIGALFQNSKFTTFVTANIFINLVYYIPQLFISDWATSLGIDLNRSTFLLCLFGIGNVVGRPVMAVVNDILVKYRLLLFIVANVVSGVITAITPLFSDSFYFLAFFMLQYAFLISGSQSMATPILSNMVPLEQLGTAFGVLIAIEGVAILIGPPLFALLPNYAVTFTTVGLILVTSAVFLALTTYAQRISKFVSCSNKAVDTVAKIDPIAMT